MGKKIKKALQVGFFELSGGFTSISQALAFDLESTRSFRVPRMAYPETAEEAFAIDMENLKNDFTKVKADYSATHETA